MAAGRGRCRPGGWRRGCGGPGAFPGPGRPGRGRGRTTGRGSVAPAPRPGCGAVRLRAEFGDAAPAGTVTLGAASGRRAVGPRVRTRVFSHVLAPGMGARRRRGARVWVSRRGRRGVGVSRAPARGCHPANPLGGGGRGPRDPNPRLLRGEGPLSRGRAGSPGVVCQVSSLSSVHGFLVCAPSLL